MKNAIRHTIVVEDTTATDLKVYVMDASGCIVCLNHTGLTIWHKQLDFDKSISSMTLGDVNGDGLLDIVVTVQVSSTIYRIHAMNAETGHNLQFFPKEVIVNDNGLTKTATILPSPLLVNLHNFNSREKTLQMNGLHIIQPIHSKLYVIEGKSGCSQSIPIGEVISSIRVHPSPTTSNLDLVVTTSKSTEVILESNVQHHPLNTVLKNSIHGLSSMGIYFISRNYALGTPLSFEIFHKRPPNNQQYTVEIHLLCRNNHQTVILSKVYNQTGIYNESTSLYTAAEYEHVQIVLTTTHGLTYDDRVPILPGHDNILNDSLLFGMLILPILITIILLLLFPTPTKTSTTKGKTDRIVGGILGKPL